MNANWIVLAILAGLASNTFNYLNRYILKDGDDPTAYAWLFEIFRLVIFFLILPFDHFFIAKDTTILTLIALGIVEVFSVYVFMKMHSTSHLSISTIISRTRLIWVPILAFLFLGERLHTSEYIGVIVLFVGLSIAVSPHKLTFDKGVQWAYLSALIIGILTILQKASAEIVSPPLVIVSASLPTVVILPFIMKSGLGRIKSSIRKNFHLKIVSGTCNVISMYLYILALQSGPVSKVASIYQGMMIVSIVAGILFLKEKENAVRKMIGGAVTLVGVLLMTVV